jgi:hypothetical protein
MCSGAPVVCRRLRCIRARPRYQSSPFVTVVVVVVKPALSDRPIATVCQNRWIQRFAAKHWIVMDSPSALRPPTCPVPACQEQFHKERKAAIPSVSTDLKKNGHSQNNRAFGFPQKQTWSEYKRKIGRLCFWNIKTSEPMKDRQRGWGPFAIRNVYCLGHTTYYWPKLLQAISGSGISCLQL